MRYLIITLTPVPFKQLTRNSLIRQKQIYIFHFSLKLYMLDMKLLINEEVVTICWFSDLG